MDNEGITMIIVTAVCVSEPWLILREVENINFLTAEGEAEHALIPSTVRRNKQQAKMYVTIRHLEKFQLLYDHSCVMW